MQEASYSAAVTTSETLRNLVRKEGLTPAERLALVALTLEPDLTVMEAAEALHLSRNTVGKAFAKAEQHGIERAASARQRATVARRRVETVHERADSARPDAQPVRGTEPPPEEGYLVAAHAPLRGALADGGARAGAHAQGRPRHPQAQLAASVLRHRQRAGFRGRDLERTARECAKLLDQEVTEGEIIEWCTKVKVFTVGWVVNAMNEANWQPQLTGARLRVHGPTLAEQTAPDRVWD